MAQHYLSIASETPRPSASSAARTASGGAGAGAGTGGGGVRGQIAVEFLERRRKRTGGVGVWFPGFTGNGQGEGREEEVCWERWVLDVTVATPRTEGGELNGPFSPFSLYYFASIAIGGISLVIDHGNANYITTIERLKVRQAMNRSLHKATMDIITYVNRDKDHIPSIVNESNPFPYQIILNPQPANWSNRLGLY